MDNQNFQKYKQLYIRTANELLTKLATGLTNVMHGDKESIETVHRDAHSLKGQSLFMGYQQIGQLSRMLEYIFRDISDGKIQFSDTLFNQVNQAIHALKGAVSELEHEGKEEDLRSEISSLSSQTGVMLTN